MDFTYCDEKITLIAANEQFFSVFGIDSDSIGSIDGDYVSVFQRFVDYNKIIDLLNKNIHRRTHFSVPAMLYNNNKEQIYVQFEVKVLSTDEHASMLRAAIMNVSKLAAKINRHNEKIGIVASLSADLIFDYNIKNDVLKLSVNENGEFVQTYEIKDFESEMKKRQMVFEDDIPVFEKLCDAFRLGGNHINFDLRLLDDNSGEYLWNNISGKTITNKSSVPVRIVGKITNISENKNTEIRLIDRAERDPLTKIYNKATTTSLVKDFLRTDSRDTFDALIIVDVDNFKQVNDNLGHLFGDSILVDLSQEMQDLFRSSDIVGRIGGDEFLVFLRGIKHKKHIEDKATDICRIFELLYSGEHEEKITGSLGIAVFPQDGDTFEELFKKADIALYSSKNEGKNCFTFYSESNNAYGTDDAQAYVNHYRKDVPLMPNSRNLFDNEITDFAFDIMNKTKDVSSAINLLLSKVGKHFNLSRVSVLEKIDEPYSLKYTYQWCAKSIPSQLGKISVMKKDKWDFLLNSYDENDVIFHSDVKSDESSEYFVNFRNQIDDLQVCAVLETQVLDSGEYKGCVSFHDCEHIRAWTVDEVRALKTISKIISSYLLKMRAFQKANLMVEKLTNYDKLTNLPRFNKFKDMVCDFVKCMSPTEKLVLAYTDINNFKYINEKYGADNGDRILKSYANSLSNINADVRCSSRVFSDKFITLLSTRHPDDIPVVIHNFLDDFTLSEKMIQPDYNVSIACGIYIIDDPVDFDISVVIDNVNIARKIAKNCSEETTCIVFKDEMKNSINRSIEIVNEAKHALVNKEFVVYYQPKVGLDSLKLVGAEALVRWKKPDGTLIPPAEFIPYLEKNGLIVNVDFYVYEEVCKFIRLHLDDNRAIVPISVNVSRVHLRDPRFLDKVCQIINKYRIPPHLIEFELTESVFLENQSAAVSTMEEMKKMGFSVSIDDFGSGFSSLNLLKSLPVDILKIDKEFFANDTLQRNDQIVISSIISMANRMDIAVICEGVETKDQVEFLRDSQCDMVQGYYYARPISADEFIEFNAHPVIKNT